MAQAAYSKKVQVSTTGTSGWQDVPCTGPTLEIGGTVIESTHMAQSAGDTGWRDRFLGLHDWNINVGECVYATAGPGSGALTMIRNAKLNRTPLFVQYLIDGTTANGFKGQCVVEGFNFSGGVDDKEMVTITLPGKGAIAATT